MSRKLASASWSLLALASIPGAAQGHHVIFGLAIFGIRWRKMIDKQMILQACNPNVARQRNTKNKGINQSVQMILPARKVTSTSNKEHVRKKIKGLFHSGSSALAVVALKLLAWVPTHQR